MTEKPSSRAVRLVGRSSSHFTRTARVFAGELDVPYEFMPIHDMTALDPQLFADNPALKMPILIGADGSRLFGSQNICRALAELARPSRRIVWPEDVRDAELRNAHELAAHCMQSQVQLVMGTVVSKLSAQDPFFAKIATGLRNSLSWFDDRLPDILAALPQRDLSLLEVSLFCLVEHLQFRPTLDIEQYSRLRGFAQNFSFRPSAQKTAYCFDTKPAG